MPVQRFLVPIGCCLLMTLYTVTAVFAESSEQFLAKGKHEAAIAEAQKEVLSRPREHKNFVKSLRIQARAFLAVKKPDEALRCAKAVFNLCDMTDTAEALLLVDQCLEAAYPDDRGIRERFRAEQEAGAMATIDQSPSAAHHSSVMDSILINGDRFNEAMAKFTDDMDGMLSKGNLLLASDRAKEARPLFEKVFEIAPADRLLAVTENIARCIKAEDGTIGRANAFVLSLRPKREPAVTNP